MPRYDVFLEGRTESSTCYFGVAVIADDQKEAEYLGHEAGRKKHRECDEIEVVSVRLRQAGKRRLCQCVPLKERALNLVTGRKDHLHHRAEGLCVSRGSTRADSGGSDH